MTRVACGAALVAVLLAGCDTGAEPGAAPSVTPGSPALAPAATEPTPSPHGPASPTAAPSVSATAGSAGTTVVDVEQRHPNGSVLRVTGVTVAATSITLQVEVVNGLADRIFLGYSGNTMRLDDDLGTTYEFLPPPDNEDLEIEGRGTLTGSFVFYGVPDPAATSLRLQSGVSGDGPRRTADVQSQSANETFPVFTVDIPLEP
jgi:hypothetical protein